jgi:hypothetical protein
MISLTKITRMMPMCRWPVGRDEAGRVRARRSGGANVDQFGVAAVPPVTPIPVERAKSSGRAEDGR